MRSDAKLHFASSSPHTSAQNISRLLDLSQTNHANERGLRSAPLSIATERKKKRQLCSKLLLTSTALYILRCVRREPGYSTIGYARPTRTRILGGGDVQQKSNINAQHQAPKPNLLLTGTFFSKKKKQQAPTALVLLTRSCRSRMSPFHGVTSVNRSSINPCSGFLDARCEASCSLQALRQHQIWSFPPGTAPIPHHPPVMVLGWGDLAHRR